MVIINKIVPGGFIMGKIILLLLFIVLAVLFGVVGFKGSSVTQKQVVQELEIK